MRKYENQAFWEKVTTTHGGCIIEMLPVTIVRYIIHNKIYLVKLNGVTFWANVEDLYKKENNKYINYFNEV